MLALIVLNKRTGNLNWAAVGLSIGFATGAVGVNGTSVATGLSGGTHVGRWVGCKFPVALLLTGDC